MLCSLEGLSREQRLKFLTNLSERELLTLLYDWREWARPEQLAPTGEWGNWLALAGRGWGKTRVGAEWVRQCVETTRTPVRIALVGRTAADVRKVMVEGESGLLAVCPPWNRPRFNPSRGLITWPNRSMALLYSAEEPDRLRGPQHHYAWCDEMAAWNKGGDTWDNLQMGLRLGDNPQTCITTTPRPIKLIRELLKDSGTVAVRGSMFQNKGNLPKKFLETMQRKYAGTRLGRQELYAEVLDDTPGALWTRNLIERARVDFHPDIIRIIIGVDPAVTSGENSDSTGIIVVGLGTDHHAYVLRDLTCKLPPIGWAARVKNAFAHFNADRVVGEVNNGGDLVEAVLRSVDQHISYKSVRASRGKRVRAEPIAALYEQGLIHHVRPQDPDEANHFNDLEDQMCNFVPDNLDDSPDNMDALVWALTELYMEPEETEQIVYYDEPVRISPY